MRTQHSKIFGMGLVVMGILATSTNASLILDLSSQDAVASAEPLAPGFLAEGAFDNSTVPDDRWYGGGGNPVWVYVPLGDTYNIERVDIDWEFSSGVDYDLYTYLGATAPSPDTNLGDWTLLGSMTGRSGIDGTGGTFDDEWNLVGGSVTFNNGTGTESGLTSALGNFLLLNVTENAGAVSVWEIDVHASVVPEPSTISFLTTGFGLLAFLRRKFKGLIGSGN